MASTGKASPPVEPDPSSDVLSTAKSRVQRLRLSGASIYDELLPDRSELFFPDDELELLLAEQLAGHILTGPIRTRSKLAKMLVATSLGYPPPASFRREYPRFPGQDLDVYVQTSNNLQIWNEEVSPDRRYVLIRPNETGEVVGLRVVRGQQIANWDLTGTLTSKYQAKRAGLSITESKLVSPADTDLFGEVLKPGVPPDFVLARQTSRSTPLEGQILPIAELYERLLTLTGRKLAPVRSEQDRVRGELLQEEVCQAIGLSGHDNHGQWPDIVSQALEVKLQTSPTIDLGLVLPSDESLAPTLNPRLRHCDARYLVAYGQPLSDGSTLIEAIVLATGQDFFNEFRQFGGLVQNRKRQIRLPDSLFQPIRRPDQPIQRIEVLQEPQFPKLFD